MDITIRKAALSDVGQVAELINTTAKALIEKGINQWEYPCDAKIVEEEVKQDWVFILESQGEALGSFSIKEIDKYDAINLSEQSDYLYRAIISPKYQGKKLGNKIIQYVRERKSEGKDIYLDCWAGNDNLRKFYSDNGCTHIGDYPEEDYMISVFRV